MEEKRGVRSLGDMRIKNIIKLFELFESIDGDIYHSILYRKSRFSYAFLTYSLHLLEKNDLIRREENGRVKLIFLTERGEKLKNLLLKAKEIMGVAYV